MTDAVAAGDHRSRLGIALVLASAAVFGLTGVLTKAISADAWTIVGWHGLFGALFIGAYVFWRRRRQVPRHSLRLGWRGWLLATVGSAASIAFIAAFKNTYVANVAIIYATVPFAAAILERVLLGEKFRGQTMGAAFVSLAGVAIMVGAGLGAGRLAGDLLAHLMMLGSGFYMVLIRVFRDTPVVWAGAVSAFQLFVVCWLFTHPLAVTARDAVLLVTFGFFFALAAILWTEGTRLITAAESGLLGSAEVAFAIVFAWLFLAELPPEASAFGGAIVLGAVCWHARRDWLRQARRQAD